MKTLKEFIQATQHNMEYDMYWDHTSAFPIARVSMPQIDDVDDFIKYLDSVGNKWSISFKDVPTTFRPTQIDYHVEKVNAIAENLVRSSYNNKPIIVSEDGFVLDGHHRYLAACLIAFPIKILQVSLPINKLLAIALDYTENG